MYMRLLPFHSSIFAILFLFLSLICGIGIAESPPDISHISITSIILTPEVYEPGDTGTVELTIQNKGNSSVQPETVSMTEDEVRVLSSSYTLVSPIGIGDSRTYRFDFIAPMEPGVYYPYISVNTASAGFLRYPVPIRVDTTKPLITIMQAPSSLTPNREATMQIQVANSRPDTIRNVQIVPLIQGKPAIEMMEIIPNQYFVGTLETEEVRVVDFDITSTIEENLTFILYYQTGDNRHESEVTFPITFSVDKKQADMALSSISFSTGNGAQQVTGDITNVGLETAYSVTVTVCEGANPVFPYKDYVLGTLNADDFASFQLTFEPLENSNTATIVATFKDKDGNQYIKSLPIEFGGRVHNMPQLITSQGNSGGQSGMQVGGGGRGATVVAVGPGPMGRSSAGSEEVVPPSESSPYSSPYVAIAIIVLLAAGVAYYFHQRKNGNSSKKIGKKARKDLNLMKEIESYDADTKADEPIGTAEADTIDEK